MYQVTPAAPASGYAPSDTADGREALASGSVEPSQVAPENAVQADDYDTLPGQGETCVPDASVPAHDPTPAIDPAIPSVTINSSGQNQSDDPQSGLSAAAAPIEQAEPVKAPGPEPAQAAEPTALLKDISPPVENPAVSGGTVPLAGVAAVPQSHADNSSSPAASDGTPAPCKISAQVEGSPAVEMPVFLVDEHEPAVRLSSLLDLVRSRLPADDFQRLRGSRSAEAVVSIRELASAGFNFQVVGGGLAISVNG